MSSERSARPLVLLASVVCTFSAPARAQLLPPEESSEPLTPGTPPPTVYEGRGSYLGWMDLSLRGSLLNVDSGGGQRTTEGGLASLELFSISNGPVLEERIDAGGAIGGGSGGLEGEVRADMLLGWRGYVTDEHGPFVRAGLVSRLFSNDAFRFSYFDFAGEAGYQYIDRRLGLDVGVQGGGGSGGTLFGAFATMAAGPALLRAEWQHFLESNGGVDDDFSNHGCLVAGGVALCLAAWSFAGTQLATTYAGLSVGVGAGWTSVGHPKK